MATMTFNSTCKFCGAGDLAWVELQVGSVKKWTLFKSKGKKHSCLSTAKQKQIAKKPLAKKPIKDFKDTEEELDAKAKKLLKKMEKEQEKAVTNMLLGGVNLIGEVPGAKKVKLKDATSLYQPVSSSSAGNTYYVVALYEGLNVASRIEMYADKYTVSIRIEGVKLNAWKNLDMLAKFNHNDKGYASVHYNTETRIEANAVIYAFLGMIQKPCLSPMPDLSKLLK